jgi:hypothetical protein
VKASPQLRPSPTSPRSRRNSGRNWNYDCSRNTKKKRKRNSEKKVRNEKRKIRLKDRKNDQAARLCTYLYPYKLKL